MRMPWIGLVLSCGLALVQPVRAGVAATPFTLQPPGDIVVPVTIAGQGPFRMLVDTGASRSAISAAVAARLESRRLGETALLTPSGQARRALVMIKGVTFGPRGPSSVVGVELESGDLVDPAIDGLIGHDILGSGVFTIDYRSSRIVWDDEPLAAAAAGTRLSLEIDSGRMMVSLPQPAGLDGTTVSRALRLIPDSGADRFVLFTAAASAVALPAIASTDRGLLRTAAGIRQVHRVVVDAIAVGDIRLRDQEAALLDRPEGGTALGDGLLPLHLFSSVTIDAGAGYLIVRR
jgi:predicted aspartyl protease